MSNCLAEEDNLLLSNKKDIYQNMNHSYHSLEIDHKQIRMQINE
jgi:hypothetical protein